MAPSAVVTRRRCGVATLDAFRPTRHLQRLLSPQTFRIVALLTRVGQETPLQRHTVFVVACLRNDAMIAT